MSEPFDTSALLGIVGGDRQFLAELVQVFVSEYPRLLTDVQRALVNREPVLLKKSAHALKSLVGNFSADDAYRTAEQLEKLAFYGQLDGADQLCELLEQETRRLERALVQFAGGDK